MIHPNIRPATVADAVYLAPRLRQADKDEIRAHLGLPPSQVLRQSVQDGGPSWTLCLDQDSPALAIMGVDPVACHPELGIVWMLGSDELLKHSRKFLRGCQAGLDLMHAHHPLLGNWVDARNTVHIRWLRWMGFARIREYPDFGVERRPFIQFARLQP